MIEVFFVFFISVSHIWIGTPKKFAWPSSSWINFKKFQLCNNDPIISCFELPKIELFARALKLLSSEFDSLMTSPNFLVVSLCLSNFSVISDKDFVNFLTCVCFKILFFFQF